LVNELFCLAIERVRQKWVVGTHGPDSMYHV